MKMKMRASFDSFAICIAFGETRTQIKLRKKKWNDCKLGIVNGMRNVYNYACSLKTKNNNNIRVGHRSENLFFSIFLVFTAAFDGWWGLISCWEFCSFFFIWSPQEFGQLKWKPQESDERYDVCPAQLCSACSARSTHVYGLDVYLSRFCTSPNATQIKKK